MARARSAFYLSVLQKRTALGMLARGDRVQDVAACYHVNPGRISEIKRKWPNLVPSTDRLPPPGPYPSPAMLFEMYALDAAIRYADWTKRLEAVEAALIGHGKAPIRHDGTNPSS